MPVYFNPSSEGAKCVGRSYKPLEFEMPASYKHRAPNGAEKPACETVSDDNPPRLMYKDTTSKQITNESLSKLETHVADEKHKYVNCDAVAHPHRRGPAAPPTQTHAQNRRLGLLRCGGAAGD